MLAYQGADTGLSETDISFAAMDALLDNAKLNEPLNKSSVEEYPVTTTVTPPGVWDNVTFEIEGQVAFVVTVCVATAETADGAVMLAASVIVPAVVPVLKVTLEAPEKLAFVEPAGIVKLTVVLPVEN